ncbi:hypothetical protein CDD83_10264 [Cordyceps sp. RAO-2017]|nr:hypothetical protein CDD83_10264 [Cordyceps sp. RAO-2017]
MTIDCDQVTSAFRGLSIDHDSISCGAGSTQQALNETRHAENDIIAIIKSLRDGTSEVKKIFAYFQKEIRDIARIVSSSGNDDGPLWKIVEECFNNTLSTSGTLRFKNFHAQIHQSHLGKHLEPPGVFESGRDGETSCSDSQDYSANEGDSAAACLESLEHGAENARESEQTWINFWVRALSHCPDGPTLFYPSADCHVELELRDVPPLFRAFDRGSSGRNNSDLIASIASINEVSRHGKTNLLSLEKKDASEMLHKHLTKSCFGGDISDNLMSWSSSLLFVIQYAIWRCHILGHSSNDVYICAVDSKRFPRGQFARDMPLIRAYRDTAEPGGDMDRFFRFRLEDERYDNGEYLSQGAVHLTERSCVISLHDLEQAGLNNLYPDFKDPEAKKQWTKRVRYLRTFWSTEQTTTGQEIRYALRVAKKFTIFNTLDIALLLLVFKNRTIRTARTEDVQESPESLKEYGPDEVQRYLREAATMHWHGRGGFDSTNLHRSCKAQILENVFQITET